MVNEFRPGRQADLLAHQQRDLKKNYNLFDVCDKSSMKMSACEWYSPENNGIYSDISSCKI